jgi:type IV pilus biogenesis protein CpaD/CtpE
MTRRLAVLGAAAALAAGCASKKPQTADEFRQMAPGAFMVQVQSFEVKRSAREIELAGLGTCKR